MTPIFSIVIPFYNTEKEFYEKSFGCLKTLPCDLAEILIVDDGSDSLFGEELDRFLSTNLPDALVFHKTNGGQNAARQFGIDRAVGKYVLFLDSDDYLDVDCLLELADYLRDHDPAVVAFGHDVVSPEGNTLQHFEPWPKGFNPLSLQGLALNSDSLWRQCYNLDKLKKAPFKLVQGVRIGEDLSSAMSLNLLLGEGVSFGRVLYHYVKRSSSIIHNPPKDVLFDIFNSFDEVVHRCAPSFYGCRDEVEWMAILHCVYWGSMRIVQTAGADSKMKAQVFAWINRAFPEWRRNKYLKSETVARSLDFLLLVNGFWRMYSLVFKAMIFIKRRLPEVDS